MKHFHSACFFGSVRIPSHFISMQFTDLFYQLIFYKYLIRIPTEHNDSLQQSCPALNSPAVMEIPHVSWFASPRVTQPQQ